MIIIRQKYICALIQNKFNNSIAKINLILIILLNKSNVTYFMSNVICLVCSRYLFYLLHLLHFSHSTTSASKRDTCECVLYKFIIRIYIYLNDSLCIDYLMSMSNVIVLHSLRFCCSFMLNTLSISDPANLRIHPS